MRTVKDILIVALLLILVTLTWLQEGDIMKLNYQTLHLEKGCVALAGGLGSLNGKLDSVNGGLGSLRGELDSLKDETNFDLLLSASCTLRVELNPVPPGFTGGSGVFLSDNILLTAKHVIENRTGLSGVMVTDVNGQRYTVVEILEDFDDDLAVVVIAGRTGSYLEIGSHPSLGDNLICIGSPFSSNRQLIISWGRVSSEKRNKNFIYDGFVWHGCSGGPVISNGKLIGIVVARLSGGASLGFAVPVERLDLSLMARIK